LNISHSLLLDYWQLANRSKKVFYEAQLLVLLPVD
jgi:hypothetical protein